MKIGYVRNGVSRFNNFPVEPSRASSLNLAFSPGPVYRQIPRQISKQLTNSQAGRFDQRRPPCEYYESSNEDLRLMHVRIDEMNRRIMKNTEDIMLLRGGLGGVADSLREQMIVEVERSKQDTNDALNDIKKSIQKIKNQIVETNIIWQNQFTKFDSHINEGIEKIERVQSQKAQEEIKRINTFFEYEHSKILGEIRTQMRGESNREYFRSKLRYPFRSIRIVHEESLEVFDKRRRDTMDSEKVRIGGQSVYFVDEQGYLLDEEGYYLMDDKGMIRLNQHMLQRLRDEGILKA